MVGLLLGPGVDLLGGVPQLGGLLLGLRQRVLGGLAQLGGLVLGGPQRSASASARAAALCRSSSRAAGGQGDLEVLQRLGGLLAGLVDDVLGGGPAGLDLLVGGGQDVRRPAPRRG